MKRKIHGAVFVLFVLAGISYAANWFVGIVAFGVIGVALELGAWFVWVDKNREITKVTKGSES